MNKFAIGFVLFVACTNAIFGEELTKDESQKLQVKSDLQGSESSGRFLNIGGLLGGYPSTGGRPYYPGGGNYYPNSGGGYYPSSGGGFYPSTGSGYYPSQYPTSAGGYYPNGYPGGTNVLGGGVGGYNGYGGYGGYGGNGGLNSYYGYFDGDYRGHRNLGYGYYTGTDRYGLYRHREPPLGVSGFRGYD